MADFLELEDASGLLELEDASGFLALEDDRTDTVRLLGVESKMELPGAALSDRRRGFLADERQRRQVKELEDHVQHLLRGADRRHLPAALRR